MARWQRPYPSPTRAITVGIAGLCAVVSAGLASVAIAAVIDGDLRSAAGSAAVAALTALFAVTAGSASRAGLFVDAVEGVMIRRMDRTRCWSWAAVARLEARPAGLLTYGLPAGRETLWLVLNDGDEVETPLRWIDGDGSLRQGAQDDIEWLDRTAFAMSLDTMRRMHRAAVPPDP